MRDEYLFKKYGVQNIEYILDKNAIRFKYEEEENSFQPFDPEWTAWVELSWGNEIASNSFGASYKEAIENCILILLKSNHDEVKEIVSKYSLKWKVPLHKDLIVIR